jgi:uncharacterized membrane protein
MTSTRSETPDPLVRRRRYRRLMYLAVIAGVIGFVGASELGYPIVGVATYWLGILAFVGIWKGTSVSVQDERDCDLERRASHVTLLASGFVGILVFPALVALEAATSFTPPAFVDTALGVLVALYATFGVAYGWFKYTR